MLRTRISNIPDELKQGFRWVRTIGDDKRPYCVFDDKPASSTKSETWGTFQEAVERTTDKGGYLGYVFNDDGYIGIDIDHCITPQGTIDKWVLEVIQEFNSYTEISKSGDGIHIIIKGDIPFEGSQHNGIEIYKKARFFVLTGNIVGNCEPVIRSNDEFLKSFIKQMPSSSSNNSTSRGGNCKWKPRWSTTFTGVAPVYPVYPLVGEGSRHIAMVSFCGQWWSGGISKEDLLNIAMRVNRDYICPSLETNEIENIVRSCIRYAR